MSVVRRCAAVLAGLIVTLSVGATPAEARGAAPAQPVQEVVLTPGSGPPGTRVVVAGQLAATCATANSVSVEWDDARIAGAAAFTVPDGADVGGHKVLVRCTFSDGVDSSSFTGSASFTVEAAVVVTATPTETPDQTNPTGDQAATGGPAGTGEQTPGLGDPPSVPEAVDPGGSTDPPVALLVILIGVAVVVAAQVAARRRASRSSEASGLRLVAVRGPRSGPVLTGRRR